MAALLPGYAAAARARGTKPHSRITGAAIDALGAEQVLIRHLESNVDRLPACCMMTDRRRGLITGEAGGTYTS